MKVVIIIIIKNKILKELNFCHFLKGNFMYNEEYINIVF